MKHNPINFHKPGMMRKSHNGISNKQSGFTLIELLVVIAIIALLASVVLASLRSAKERAYDAQIKSDMAQIRNALELYAGSNGYVYPLTAVAPKSTNIAQNKAGEEQQGGLEGALISIMQSGVDVLKKSFATVAYAQSRDYGCAYFDDLESVLVPNFIGKIPKHPLDDGESVCYKYFALPDGTMASAYGSLVTERYTNGINKQVGVVVGMTDFNSLKSMCTESKGLENTPFPMFSATGGGDICEGETVVDIVIGVTNGDGDLSSDSYI